MVKRVCFLLLLLLAGVFTLAAQPYAYVSRSLEDGLSHSNVTVLLSDRRGSLWIGTRNGLNRFDRQEIEVFLSDGETSEGLPDNEILGLSETPDGTIWIRTVHGIARYRPVGDTFGRVSDAACHSSLVLGEDILFGSSGLLYHFPKGEDTPEILYPFGREAEDEADWRILDIVDLGGGEILVGTKERGLFRYRLGGEPRPFTDYAGHEPDALYRSGNGEIFVAYYGDGVRRYDPEGNELAHYTVASSGLANDYVLDFAEYDGLLWIATDGGGISLLSLSDGGFQTLRHVSGDPDSLPSNSVAVLYPDPSGALWAGTVKHGFFQVRRNPIRSFHGSWYGLKDNAVTSMYRDGNGTLWVGTDGGGLHCFDAGKGRFTLLPGTEGKVLSIAGYDRRHLLVSLYMEGCFLVDRNTGRKEPFVIVDDEVNRRECFMGYLPRIAQVSEEKLYFLGYSPWAYDLRSHVFSPMQIEGEVSGSKFRMACSDGSRSYFYKGNQVFLVRADDDVIRPLFRVGERETVTSLALGGRNVLWVGTDRGLGRYDLPSETYAPVSTGLFDSVSALEPDTEGRLWICARNQLFTYLPAEDRFVSWSESDGFRPNDIKMLYQNARDPERLYLGGSGGLVQIDRNIPVPSSEDLSVFLDRVEVNGAPSLSRLEGNVLRIPWNYQSLSASFLVKGCDAFRKMLFRYTVEGSRSRTFESPDSRLELPTLSPGTYHVRVSCMTKGGVFTAPQELLQVVILPPWYRTAWFRGLLALLLVAAAWLLIWWMRRRHEAKNKSSMAHFLEGMLQEQEEEEDPSHPEQPSADPGFRARLDAAVDRHLSDPDLDVKFLSEELALSRTALYAKVKEETGLGVKDYVNRRRIERSVDLLLHTDKNINEIAYEVGFSYPRYFSTSFKSMKGVTPTRFKQENRHENP